ncbi:hypothetical protein OPKNFCMD_5504 [Methylobacterium crusticola]|uniref:Uncharacterized protein n=1 Tax=Methylobacterium crusticola TaxID=1697972 RepID=A0ABQ4R4Y7_9HYPH|nr:hypothetical protein [Methylobacterium crusticola]GJD52737.1 hypothetical protein OPKNFCMD_5504 [Methylobacterium crusticola]
MFILRLIFNQNALVVLCALAFSLGIFEAFALAEPYELRRHHHARETLRADTACAVTIMGDVAFCAP